MLGFKSFRSASLTRGIELMHMVKKHQLIAGNKSQSIRCWTILFIGSLIFVSANSSRIRISKAFLGEEYEMDL